jgi:hypothetical protein
MQCANRLFADAVDYYDLCVVNVVLHELVNGIVEEAYYTSHSYVKNM